MASAAVETNDVHDGATTGASGASTAVEVVMSVAGSAGVEQMGASRVTGGRVVAGGSVGARGHTESRSRPCPASDGCRVTSSAPSSSSSMRSASDATHSTPARSAVADVGPGGSEHDSDDGKSGEPEPSTCGRSVSCIGCGSCVGEGGA